MSLTPRAPARVSSGVLTLILGGLQAVMPLSIDLYLPGLPTIAHDLHVGSGAAQFTLAVFLIGVAFGQAAYGPITDKYGRKKPLLAGLTLYVLGAVLCALASSITVLVAGRFLQALGASAGAVITTAIVRDLWSGKALAERFSLLMLVMGVAPIIAPSLGGLILTRFSWHGLFWLLAVFGVLMAVTVTLLPETSLPRERAQARLRGAAATYAALLRNAPFTLYTLAGACMAGVLFAYITGASFVYIETLGVTPGVFAALFGLNAAGLIGASQLNRALLRRFDLFDVTRAAVTAGLLLALLLLATVATRHEGAFTLTPLLFGLLATVGCTFPNIPALALDRVHERPGSAAALLGCAQYVLGGVAGSLVGALGNGTALPMTGVLAVCAALASVFLLAARKTGRADDRADDTVPASQEHSVP